MKPVDFKKSDKQLYAPGTAPGLVDVPPMHFLMVDGSGDPNDSPAFQQAVELLYSLSYDIRMSPKKGEEPDGYYPYVVPPLEGLWWVDGDIFCLTERGNWLWTLMIRQPEFVNEQVFQQSWHRVQEKKRDVFVGWEPRFEVFSEGKAVQILHVGPYETEPASVALMEEFCTREGWVDQVGPGAKHHEIYLSDPRKVNPEKRRTILRHPVQRL